MTPADIARFVHRHRAIESRPRLVGDATFEEGASRLRAMASFRNLAIGAPRLARVDNLTKATRHNTRNHTRTLPFIGTTT